MNATERQYLRTTALIRAAEDWSDQYKKDPKTHSKLIRTEAKWQLALNKHFKKMADNATSYINLGAYAALVQPKVMSDDSDYNIDVIINDDQLDQTDGAFITLSLDIVTELVATGAVAGQNIYDMPLGLSSTSANIQKLGLSQVASLVGKMVQPDGSIVNNPKAQFNITETIRNDIAQAIKAALAQGETIQEAIARVQSVIADPVRAQRIARTESVNAYQQGLAEFADESGAVGKEWQDVGAIDICAENTAAGPIPIDDVFPSGDSEPTAHVNCRCGIRYIHQTEWNALGN